MFVQEVQRSYGEPEIIDGAAMHLPVTPGEARKIMWDVNNAQLVRQTLGVGGCALVETIPQNHLGTVEQSNYRFGKIIDGETSIGGFLVYDHPPSKVTRFLGKIAGYEPRHVISVVAELNEKPAEAENVYRSWRFRLPWPSFLKSQFSKVRDHVFAPVHAPALAGVSQ